MATRSKTDIIHARLRPGIKRMAEKLAASENRNLTNWLETTIERLYKEANLENGADNHRRGPEPSR
jgi:hypothetical protein